MNELTYGNKNLSDFGAYYDSHSAFGSPERDVELVEVAGKNGALIIDNDRYRNIELTFNCYIHRGFLGSYRSLMAYLQSLKGYNRLEISQEPNHFRMASFNMGSQPTPNQFHKSGQFPVVFNCKPQRFLKSGETPVSSQSQDEEYEGNPVSINNPSGLSTVKSLEVGLSPIQNLNGYDSPWVGGAGKNLLNMANIQIGKACNTTTNNDRATVYMDCEPDTNYAISINDRSAFSAIVWCEKASADATTNTYLTTFSSNATSFKTKSTSNVICIQFSKTGISANDFNGIEVQIEKGTVNTSYEPYSNICPISGHTEVNVVRTGKNLFDKDAVENNKYLDTTTGLPVSATNYVVSDYIPVFANQPIYIPETGSIRRWFYDTNKTPKTYLSQSTAQIFTPTEDGYIRVSILTTSFPLDTIQIEYGSSASSYESYTGTTYPVKFHTGKNLFDGGNVYIVNAGGASTYHDITLTKNADSTFKVSGTASAETRLNTNYTGTFKAGKKYTISVRGLTNGNIRLVLQGNPSTAGINYTSVYPTSDWSSTFTITADCTFNYFYIDVQNGAIVNNTIAVQIEECDIATSFEPYGTDGVSTAYGGTVDVVSGMLTVEYAVKDLGDMWWGQQNTGITGKYRFRAQLTGSKQSDTGTEDKAISSTYQLLNAGGTWTPTDGFTIANDGYMYIYDSTKDTLDGNSFKTAVTGYTVVYPLATPITYHLTPTQVSLLTGVNVITTDGNGDMTVTVTEPTLLVNPTLFESKPLLRIYGTGTVNINNQYITISAHSFPYIDIDCELMDAFYGSSNANQYVTFSDNDYITLKSGNNYIAYGNQIEITPRWYEI